MSSVAASPHSASRPAAACAVAALASLALFVAMLFTGTVEIPAADVWAAVLGGGDESARLIVTQLRLPMAITAFLAGAGLALAGLLLQTVFDNPLAGPSILGVSTGASLGVAVLMLLFGGAALSAGYFATLLGGALLGAAAVLAALLLFSTMVRSSAILLIIGILISYLASSAISLLNFFATQEGVHSYVIWGLGNFSGVTLDRLAVFAPAVLVPAACCFLLVKPLNALLLGDVYAVSMGVSIRSTRNALLALSGILTAAVTAFCGPIGFLGLVVPHVARMACGTSNHASLLPSTILFGGAIGLLCAFLSVCLGGGSLIPVNAITPVLSFPIIIYVILNRNRLSYMR